MVGGAAAEAEGLSQENATGGGARDLEASIIGREGVGVAQERQAIGQAHHALVEVWELEDGGARASMASESASQRGVMEGGGAGSDGDGDGDGEEQREEGGKVAS